MKEAFELPDLPYEIDGLEPYISRETLDYHWGKHHAAYVKKLNDLVKGSDLDESRLDDIVRSGDPGELRNQAGQHWNHTFYWFSMSPEGGGSPDGEFAERLDVAFGGFEKFRDEFDEAAAGIFGSGWAWLVARSNGGKLAVATSANAGNPIQDGDVPLLTCDMWEHAYYIDYRNEKEAYLDAFWKVVDWRRVGSRLSSSG